MGKKLTRFHIKIDEDLKRQLRKICTSHSLSAMITKILGETLHLIEKKGCTLDTIESPKEETQTEELYIVMEDTHKEKLFEMQHHFRLRSKASLLRFLLRIYLTKQQKYGGKKLRQVLGRSRRRWEYRKRQKSIWEKKRAAHMETIYMECGYGPDGHLRFVLFPNSA